MSLLDRLVEPHRSALAVVRARFVAQPTWRVALLGGAVAWLADAIHEWSVRRENLRRQMDSE